MALAAVTGATGFLGRHLVRALAEAGFDVRVLMRRDPVHPLWREIEPQVVLGSLSDPSALERLCDGADVVIHCAGLIKARNRAEFDAVNRDGAVAVAHAALKTAPTARFLLISSLVAREPQLSHYAASKRAGEEAAAKLLGDRLTIVRPPAIYGPGDVETFALFKAAATAPLLPVFDSAARIALVHVEDAADQIVALAKDRNPGALATLCDANLAGYSWVDLMSAASEAVGRKPRLVKLPDGVVKLVGMLGSLAAKGSGVAMLTSEKAREILHRDWSVSLKEHNPRLPSPRYGLKEGFAQTVAWYRNNGWLAPL
ncbi:NAD-dependent epimerase/dehydratase family protein [Caulobacter sp. NIBR2454]|uniref:NAD-dependent epimerase/dehydratase family protein n=1 Tax=Caulobacter sp. NIBR2454 TaxID=3015996 RepID=UPI0022B6E806|nr:SDR family NAD(P)-dependent oxidoreductase [Caulobacter sp. NIBR2454]